MINKRLNVAFSSDAVYYSLLMHILFFLKDNTLRGLMVAEPSCGRADSGDHAVGKGPVSEMCDQAMSHWCARIVFDTTVKGVYVKLVQNKKCKSKKH